MSELKPLSRDAIPAALDKAERYRLLNEPVEAESICLDVLEVDQNDQRALVVLLLALTDQFGSWSAGDPVTRAREIVPRLAGEYERAYYAGIIAERRAKAHLAQGSPGFGAVVYDWFRDAMACYERAEARRPPGNDDAILRWNACVRLLRQNPRLQPQEEPARAPVELE